MDGIFLGMIRFFLGIILLLVGLWEVTMGHWAPGLAFMGVGALIFGFPGTGMMAGSGGAWMIRGSIGFILIIAGAALYALNIGR